MLRGELVQADLELHRVLVAVHVGHPLERAAWIGDDASIRDDMGECSSSFVNDRLWRKADILQTGPKQGSLAGTERFDDGTRPAIRALTDAQQSLQRLP